MNNKKNLVRLLAIGVFVGVLGFVLLTQKKEDTDKTQVVDQPKKIQATAVIYPDVDKYLNGQQVTIMIDSRKNAITAVQLELKYDSTILSNVKVVPVSSDEAFFKGQSDHLVLFNKQDVKLGRISYAVGISPSSLSRAGIGKLAILSYTKKPNTPQATITFLPKTRATQANFSGTVLAEARDIVIE